MELLERESSLGELNEALKEAASGNGRIALISGEAGIGKTTLLEQFIQPQPQRALWGVCDALFTPRPLGPLHDIARQAKGELATLLQGEITRSAIFSACLDELQAPTILVFEDIHWADEATLDLLKFLGRRMARTRSLLIVTYRDDALGGQHPLRLLLGDLARSDAVHRLVLEPLSITAVYQLVGEQDIDAESLHQQTSGNPFFVTEVLAEGGSGIPDTVRDAVLARAARLSLSGRAVLNATAVIGQRIELWLLQEVVQAEVTAVDESLTLGILLAQNDTFAFRHELARQIILDEIPPHQHVFLHQAVLDALKASPIAQKDAARLAHHAEAANDEDAILTYAPVAAKEAAALNMYRTAASLYALALPFADGLPLNEQIDLNEKYAVAAQSDGDPKRAASLAAYRRAAKLARAANIPLREGLNLAREAGILSWIGEYAESDCIMDSALAILEPLAPNRGLVDAYRTLAMRYLSDGVVETAVSYAEKGYQMALSMEQERVITTAYQVMGLCWLPLDHQEGCEHLEKCLIMALDINQVWTVVPVYINLTLTYIDVYQLEKAARLLHDGLLYAAENDVDVLTIMLQPWQAMHHLFQGRWKEGVATVNALLQQTNLRHVTSNPALAAKGRLLARMGDTENAQAVLDESIEQTLKFGNQQRMGLYYCARAEAAWLANDVEGVLTSTDAFFETAVQNRQCGFAAELAYWRWRVGESVETFDWMHQPFVLEINGNWQAAAAAWGELGCPYEQARALAEGDKDAQKAALITFEQLGARPMAERVRQKLRDAGVQIIPRGPRTTTKENPFSLTNRQLEILTLLSENLTNAQIAARLHISPKTVDHHVSAVLAKLQVSSRTEAAEIGRQYLSN
ncbi:transcriptional regulatory [hydrothermal vent metagenome]|uniref:Transcriptional regulatory n=1 Tax=hydrothermal vent metagenome TaxID=652676 RepID=A0A3B0UL19_9ZZZZ